MYVFFKGKGTDIEADRQRGVVEQAGNSRSPGLADRRRRRRELVRVEAKHRSAACWVWSELAACVTAERMKAAEGGAVVGYLSKGQRFADEGWGQVSGRGRRGVSIHSQTIEMHMFALTPCADLLTPIQAHTHSARTADGKRTVCMYIIKNKHTHTEQQVQQRAAEPLMGDLQLRRIYKRKAGWAYLRKIGVGIFVYLEGNGSGGMRAWQAWQESPRRRCWLYVSITTNQRARQHGLLCAVLLLDFCWRTY